MTAYQRTYEHGALGEEIAQSVHLSDALIQQSDFLFK